MILNEDVKLLLSVQRALLSQVTPELRSVSADVDPDRRLVSLRFVFSRQPSDSEQDTASVAATLVIADYSATWQLAEEYLVVPSGERMLHLRLLAYYRCEDEWVSPND